MKKLPLLLLLFCFSCDRGDEILGSSKEEELRGKLLTEIIEQANPGEKGMTLKAVLKYSNMSDDEFKKDYPLNFYSMQSFVQSWFSDETVFDVIKKGWINFQVVEKDYPELEPVDVKCVMTYSPASLKQTPYQGQYKVSLIDCSKGYENLEESYSIFIHEKKNQKTRNLSNSHLSPKS